MSKQEKTGLNKKNIQLLDLSSRSPDLNRIKWSVLAQRVYSENNNKFFYLRNLVVVKESKNLSQEYFDMAQWREDLIGLTHSMPKRLVKNIKAKGDRPQR